MIRRSRVLLPSLIALALPASVAWLVVSVVRLVHSATAYHVRVISRPAGAPVPSDAEVRQLLADQNHLGILAMFAVAVLALCLVVTLVTWLLGTQQRRADRR